jgi:hydrogenase expression/formation protein HypE
MEAFMPDDIVLLSHGGGGLKTKKLIEECILKHLNNPILAQMDDSACLDLPSGHLAFTTDSYVVDPLFFPGGDIGKLAACGTLNDLAMQGAEPRYLSLGLIIEEGLSFRDLDRILASMAEILNSQNVWVVTGDTKVVERGRGSGIYINTSGLGTLLPGINVHVSKAQPGDAVLVTGTLGDHGLAVLNQRQGFQFQSKLESDTAPLWGMIHPLLLACGSSVHVLRDPTRGGLSAALCDIATASNMNIRVQEKDLPIRAEVRGMCALLGLDPLNVANEGKAVVICSQSSAEKVLSILRSHSLGAEARIIGKVEEKPAGLVVMETKMGGERIIDLPSGEDLPRIC